MSWNSILNPFKRKNNKARYLDWNEYKKSRFNTQPNEVSLQNLDRHSEEE